ncbi:unnamed protein product [Cylindrotheca closterium]|uniref:Uncharacterized protein n=1 Tax=Cylindrotheca closterium TaxID=2856 RepID=A0AAD2CUB3_9STRA|nr:unnamed protein product [Cylindrotheca closterium]
MAGKKKTSKGSQRPPEVEKLLKPAIAVALAMIVYQFFKGINSEVIRVNVMDELELREVLFGEAEGKNYAVLCHAENATFPISSVFADASSDGGAPAEFRLLDCNHVLVSSEKTIYERFNLNKKQRPTIFVSGKIGPPKQVPAKHLKTGSMLVKALKNLLVPKAEKIETTQDLRSKCLDKDVCALLLKGGKVSPNYVKDAMSKLLVEFPKVAFAAIDTSVLYVKGIEAEYLPEFSSGQPRFVVFQKVTGGTGKKDGRLKTSLATLPGHGVGYGPMSNLIGEVVSKKADMKKVSTLPTIKTRTKKLEQEEKAKRERRSDQQKRQDGGTTPGGAFQTNDGTKEGRKAERDRRRAEHRKNNPNYKEKTPEEIAEMERKRRQRMEEEAAKWNMAPEDMPEGDYMFEDEDEGEYYETVDEDEEEGEEDEDVLDLD